MEPEPTPPPKPRRKWWKLGVVLVLVLVSYVLSAGPVFYLALKYMDVSNTGAQNLFAVLDFVYRPLSFLPEKPTKKIMTPYMRWWLQGFEGVEYSDE